MNIRLLPHLSALIAAMLLPVAGRAAPAPALATCAACHALEKPADSSLERLWTRKAPDLHYAGVKFRQEWLVGWLQKPTVLRPAGVMYRNVVKPGAGGTTDTIDTSQVPVHPALGPAEAKAAAEALMALGTDLNLVEKGAFRNEPPNAMMAALLFNKLRGCSSCHAGKPGEGGLSGPELYSAGARLQPDFVVAYIRDPQKFDPHVWMPKLGLIDADVQKLTSYLMTLKGAAP